MAAERRLQPDELYPADLRSPRQSGRSAVASPRLPPATLADVITSSTDQFRLLGVNAWPTARHGGRRRVGRHHPRHRGRGVASRSVPGGQARGDHPPRPLRRAGSCDPRPRPPWNPLARPRRRWLGPRRPPLGQRELPRRSRRPRSEAAPSGCPRRTGAAPRRLRDVPSHGDRFGRHTAPGVDARDADRRTPRVPDASHPLLRPRPNVRDSPTPRRRPNGGLAADGATRSDAHDRREDGGRPSRAATGGPCAPRSGRVPPPSSWCHRPAATSNRRISPIRSTPAWRCGACRWRPPTFPGERPP